jgi:hypothetical protein
MKTTKLFQFGIKKEGFNVPVLNEREARAAAGILFLLAIISANLVLMTGNLFLVRLFIVGFAIDFTIRVFINPAFSPTLILGRLATIKQKPEYTGAPQKRFAWALGLALSYYMTISLVMFNILNPINIIICFICLTLLFFETAFGICVGCNLYKLLPGKQPEACPGGACELKVKDPNQHVGIISILVLIVFGAVLFLLNPVIQTHETQRPNGPLLTTQNISV